MSLFAAVVLTWTSYNLVSAGTVYTDPRVVGYLDRLIFRTPLDVDRMLATGAVQLCPAGHGLLADCRVVSSASDLRNGFGNLRFDFQSGSHDHLVRHW